MSENRENTAVKEKQPSAEAMKDPAVAMGTQMYKDLNMSCDAVIHMLPRVKDERIKTQMTAALCFYEKTAGKVKKVLGDHAVASVEEGMMAKMGARMGIAMNTMLDATDSHIAEMVIEGSTMSITSATKLRNDYKGKPGCEELVAIADDIAQFEDAHIGKMKQFL